MRLQMTTNTDCDGHFPRFWLKRQQKKRKSSRGGQQSTTMADCNIRVIVRFRPVNERERAEGGDIATQLSFPDPHTVDVESWSSRPKQTFTFDNIFFDPTTSQEQIYNDAAKKSIEDVINGYNATIFAYGQTGAGKVLFLSPT